MANGAHKVTEMFEQELSRYTGAPYAVAVDNQSNALFLALKYEWNRIICELEMSFLDPPMPTVTLPARTYPSVPCEVLHAGFRVEFAPVAGETLKGAYPLEPTRVWDSALRFTSGMYLPETYMCLSFTGPYKHLKLGKGGAILTDDAEAFAWFKRARFSGRRECSYFEDDFDMLGWNFYMMPEIAARGLHMMAQFYNRDGTPKHNEDLELSYPDLSRFEVYR
jgi:dTDP-4-amino-4,6-dideoxygalactose transaminase